jgi:hypothetical protein
LPEAEYHHCRRQSNAEGDDQSLFEPGQLWYRAMTRRVSLSSDFSGRSQ